MSIKRINHKGKEIICIDWSDHRGISESVTLLEESAELHRTAGDKLRTLDIFKGVSGSAPLLNRAKELDMRTFYEKREKSAAVGIGSLNRLMYTLFSRHSPKEMQTFDKVEDALDYLAED